MLLRELVGRHVQAGQRVALAADPERAPDLGRTCDWAPAQSWPDGPDPDVVVVDVEDPAALARWTARWPGTPTWLLAHPAAPEELPVAPLIGAARAAGLHLVESVVLRGKLRVGVVASRQPLPVLGYLNAHPTDPPGDSSAARLAWEWALSNLVARAREASADVALLKVTRERDALRAAERAARDKERAVRESASYVLGKHLVAARRHPLRALRGIVADSRRLKRARTAG